MAERPQAATWPAPSIVVGAILAIEPRDDNRRSPQKQVFSTFVWLVNLTVPIS